MDLERMREHRTRYNAEMMQADSFFAEFAGLDDRVYAGGAIGKKHKELMGLGISVATRCEECVLYHLDGCAGEGATREEIVEAVKVGVVAGGSITFPTARFAFDALGRSRP